MKLMLVIALTAVVTCRAEQHPQALLDKVLDAQRRFWNEMNRILGGNWAAGGAIGTGWEQCEIIDPIPDDVCTLPPFVVRPITISSKIMTCGGTYKAKDFKYPPIIGWRGANENDLYTFLLISDERTLQWGVFNIPGSALLVDGSTSVIDYTQIREYEYKAVGIYGEPKDCTFKYFLYRQKERVPENAKDNIIYPISLKEFAQKHGLCGPVAAQQAWVTKP